MTVDTAWFYAFLMIFVRVGALFVAAPIFGSVGIPVQVRIGLAAVIALIMATVLGSAVGAVPESLIGFAGALLKEVSVGLLMGFLVNMLMSAAEIAGHLLDFQMGFSMSSIVDPQNFRPVTLLAVFKMQLTTVLFLILNGHHILLEAILSSYRYAPAVGMAGLASGSELISNMIGGIMFSAVQIALPVAATLVVADIALAAVSRAVPQMNVLIVGFQVKIIVGLTTMGIALPAVVWALHRLINSSETFVVNLLKVFH